MSPAVKSRMAASVRAKLLAYSKQRGELFDLALTRYGLERFLYRMSLTSHRNRLVLKGAMLFQIWSGEPHRATRDMDFLANGDTSLEAITATIKEICETPVDGDGLSFDTGILTVEEIREETEYGGIRARFAAHLGSAKIPIQLDFGVGDAVTPDPQDTDYPTLLEMPKPSILAYPAETVVAEKLEAIVKLGFTNSRMKDYFDLWFFATSNNLDSETTAEAVRRTFERRAQDIPAATPPGLTDEFAHDKTKQAQWKAFQRRVTGAISSLPEVVTAIRAFALPLFEQARKATN